MTSAMQFCGSCGRATGATSAFCGGCGRPLPSLGTAPQPAPEAAAPAQAAPALGAVAAAPPIAVRPVAPRVRLRRGPVLAVLALVLVGATMGLGLYVEATRLDKPFKQTDVGTGYSVAYSPDGSMLVVPGYSGAHLLRTADLSEVRALSEPDRPGSYYYVSVVFSPDGQLVASGSSYDFSTYPSSPGVVIVWRVSDGSVVRVLEALAGETPGVAFSPDGHLGAVSVASDDQGGSMLRIWRVSNWALVKALPVQGYSFSQASVRFSPDGTVLAVNASGGVTFVRVSDASVIRTIPGVSGSGALAFAPSGAEIAAAGSGTVLIYGVADGALHRSFRLAEAHSVAYSPDGSLLAASSYPGLIHIWRLSDGKTLRRIKAGGKHDLVEGLAFSVDGSTLASTD